MQLLFVPTTGSSLLRPRRKSSAAVSPSLLTKFSRSRRRHFVTHVTPTCNQSSFPPAPTSPPSSPSPNPFLRASAPPSRWRVGQRWNWAFWRGERSSFLAISVAAVVLQGCSLLPVSCAVSGVGGGVNCDVVSTTDGNSHKVSSITARLAVIPPPCTASTNDTANSATPPLTPSITSSLQLTPLPPPPPSQLLPPSLTPAPVTRPRPRMDPFPARPVLTPAQEAEMITRMSVAVCVGALIGIERRAASATAGLRTLTLVSLGSAIFSLTAIHGLGGDPARMGAAISTGIGFLGSGAINGQIAGSRRQLGTAASVWIAAALGVAAASGLFKLAFMGAFATIWILRWRLVVSVFVTPVKRTWRAVRGQKRRLIVRRRDAEEMEVRHSVDVHEEVEVSPSDRG